MKIYNTQITPLFKFELQIAILSALGLKMFTQHSHSEAERRITWFISEAVTKTNSKEEVYVFIPEELHLYISEFLPKTTPIDDGFYKEERRNLYLKHEKAIQHIREVLVERWLDG